MAKKLAKNSGLRLVGSFEDLVSSNIGLIKSVVSRFVKEKIEDSEFYSIGCIAIVEAAFSFDPTKAKFSTWATRCIRQAILNQIRKNKKSKSQVFLFDMEEKEKEEALIDNRRSPPLHLISLATASPEDSETDLVNKEMLLLHYVEQKSLSEIAKQFGYTKEGVRKKINKSINKIRNENKEILKEFLV